jgi:hypothetical protein
MKYMSNKKLIISSIIILSSISMFGCSNKNKASNSTADANNFTNSANTSNDTSNVTTNTSNTDKASEESSSTKSQELLNSIIDAAKDGRVISCDFAVKNTNMGDVEEKWGKADSSEWVTAAKGMYSTYSKHDIVFGANKGNQVFEVRSLDNELNTIQLSAVKAKFGTPQYDVKDNGEEIIGYKITDEFKILFVFKGGDADPVMTHYSVLYPAGTINSMAGDKGRQW